MRTAKPPRHARSAGFTLIAVLLAVGVMAGLVTAYGRHVIVSSRGGMASPQLLASREACHSGLVLARQALLSGDDAMPATIPAGDGLAGITLSETTSGHELLTIESMGEDGLGARRKAELAMQPVASTAPVGPSSLPTLSASTVGTLLSTPGLPLQHITASTTLTGVELSKLLVVHPGVVLTLNDVVLKGTILSASVLEQVEYGGFDATLAPRVLMTGNVRIDPPPELPGLAILMPEGKVNTSGADKRLQIHGDVIAHDISLLFPGAFEGHAVGVSVALADEAVLDRLGFDRKPPDWSPKLQLGLGSEPVFMALVPPSSDLGSLAPIMNYWQAD